VPVERLEDVVLVLGFRSCSLVADRAGDLVVVGFAVFVVAFLVVCDVVFAFRVVAVGEAALFSVGMSRAPVRALAFSIIALRGLEGLMGDAGRDRYDGLVGEATRGD
jgi:hypothetical protein